MTKIVCPLWDGTCLGSNCLALMMITDHAGSSRVPACPVLAAVSNGQRDLIVKPEQLAQFFRVHAASQLVCIDAGKICHSLHDYLSLTGDSEEQHILWSFVAEGRLLDIGLLEQLLVLGTKRSVRPPRLHLQDLVQRHTHVSLLDEQALQRLISSIPPATAHSHPELVTEASRRVRGIVEVFRLQYDWTCSAGLVQPSANGSSSWQIPDLALQVKADVALAHVHPNGLRLAPGAVHRIIQACLTARDNAARRLAATDARQWLEWREDGAMKFRPNGTPEIRRRQVNGTNRRIQPSPGGFRPAGPPTRPIGESNRRIQPSTRRIQTGWKAIDTAARKTDRWKARRSSRHSLRLRQLHVLDRLLLSFSQDHNLDRRVRLDGGEQTGQSVVEMESRTRVVVVHF